MQKSYSFSIIILFISITASAGNNLKTFFINTASPKNAKLEISVRIPKGFKEKLATNTTYRIMVLFGGRNWKGTKTIAKYGFGDLADEYNLFLISPSYKDDEYWYPEKWSGKALLQAIDKISQEYSIDKHKLYYYGYSAGGQCANLFYFWKPALVDAWGAHACGVWAKPFMLNNNKITFAPFIVTCGKKDAGRYHLSLRFIQEARRNGLKAIWQAFSSGHELNKQELDLAKAFFESIFLNADKKIKYIGDDQLLRYYPVDSKKTEDIEPEDRSIFFNEQTAKQWNLHTKD